MKVSDLMTKDVASVRANDMLSAAAKLMWDCDCGVVPVVEEGGDKVVSMITDRDICMSAWMRDSSPSNIRVSEVMSQKLHYCSPDDNLSSAEELMRSQQIRRIPVLDPERRLIGILSLADIARQAEHEPRRSGPDLAPKEIVSTLAGIVERPSASNSSAHS